MPIAYPPPGGGQFPYIRPFPASAFTAAVATYPTANLACFYRIRAEKAITISTISFFVGTASGNADVGIYTSTDGGTTLDRQRSSGSTAVAGSSAWQDVALTSSIALVPGVDYWIAIAADNTTFTTYRVGVQAPAMLRNNAGLAKATSFPLPSSVTSFSGATSMFLFEAA